MKKKIKTTEGYAIEALVSGVVQGVGFRPFIYRLAYKFGYKGWVQNTGVGVKIHLETENEADFKDFFAALKEDKPPLALIEDISFKKAQFKNFKKFTIKKSRKGESFVFISPDISICENCHREMMNPSDRRFRYPFINCTDCGPRYTIVKALPYDRSQTTMNDFIMCEECSQEYTDPLDRRYHAQPVACPVCGPQVELKEAKTGKKIEGGIEKASSLIKQGYILAVKGLGGFHLVCDALNPRAVMRLRKIKRRHRKPLALMAQDLSLVEQYVSVSRIERQYLLSARRPIVLLHKKREIQEIAPHLDELGIMLPYTPLHYLLLDEVGLIVATSSNKKDAPIMKDEAEGITSLCDYILTHDRPIHMRSDDSVMKIVDGNPLFLRRARGYVPYPQKVHEELKSPKHILALGGELKDTISVYKDGYVITSQFLGDLDEYQNYIYFEETLKHLCNLFAIQPEIVVTDLHPNFHTTRYAQKLGIPHLEVQHHFAHTLAPLLEHNIPPGKKVLGVSWDGFGYGSDGTAWGGEFLIADYSSFDRLAHFQNIPLPGGDLAAKQPWRMAVAYLFETYKEDFPRISALNNIQANSVKGIVEMIKNKLNSPLSSSCGRLFDAVSFLLGLSPKTIEFEAEAAMRLESAAAEGVSETYPFYLWTHLNPWQISFTPMLDSLVKDLSDNLSPADISSKFHITLAQVINIVACKAREKHGLDTVALSGGVFLNKLLLKKTMELLKRNGFKVIRPLNYSPNDESLSLGQIAYALNWIKNHRGKE